MKSAFSPFHLFPIAAACLVAQSPVALAGGIGYAPVSLWEFNEPAGTPFVETVDSVGGRVFNRDIAGAVTTGDGRLNFATSAVWPDVSTPLPENPNGLYRITVEFAEWDVSTFPMSQGPRIFFGFYEGDDLEVGVVGEIELQFFGDGIDLYFSDSDQEILVEDFAPVVLTSPLTVILEVDKGAGTFSLSYRYEVEGEWIEESRSDALSFVSAERLVGTFGVTSNRTFVHDGGLSPQIERIEVAYGLSLPEVPEGLRSAEVTSDLVSLEWDAAEGADAYQVWVRQSIGGDEPHDWTDLGETTETSILVEGLMPETAYIFQVRSLNAFGDSAFSEVFEVVTEPAPVVVPPLWEGATEMGDGWLHTDWFGLFFPVTGGAGWTYHLEHGWLFIWAESVESIFLFDHVLGHALWTSHEVYPFLLWSSEEVAWTYYLIGGEPGSRLFYDYGRAAWVSETDLFATPEM